MINKHGAIDILSALIKSLEEGKVHEEGEVREERTVCGIEIPEHYPDDLKGPLTSLALNAPVDVTKVLVALADWIARTDRKSSSVQETIMHRLSALEGKTKGIESVMESFNSNVAVINRRFDAVDAGLAGQRDRMQTIEDTLSELEK